MSCAQNYIRKGHSKNLGDILSWNYINPWPVGCPFAKIKTIINSFWVFQKMKWNLAPHINISYLLTASKCTQWKSHLLHVVQLNIITPNYSRNTTLAWLLMRCTSFQLHVGKWMKFSIWHNTSHFAGWNKGVCNAPTTTTT
jgi:hypothetical protein